MTGGHLGLYGQPLPNGGRANQSPRGAGRRYSSAEVGMVSYFGPNPGDWMSAVNTWAWWSQESAPALRNCRGTSCGAGERAAAAKWGGRLRPTLLMSFTTSDHFRT